MNAHETTSLPPMVVADLLHRFALVAEDIAGRPDVGPYEVGVLQHLTELTNILTGFDPERTRYHYHESASRAIDIMPTSQLNAWARRTR